MSKYKTIKLNVGGVLYETTAETLQESAYFQNLLGEGWEEGNADNNVLFVDRDGFLFRYILLYLRTDELNIEKKYLKSLKNEANFYLLPKLSQLIERAMSQEPKNIVYQLLNHDEFTNLSNIDVRYTTMAHTNFRRVVHQEINFIVSIKCLEKVFICPRGIDVHDNVRNFCGRACKKARDDNYVEYEYVDKTMYLVSVESN